MLHRLMKSTASAAFALILFLAATLGALFAVVEKDAADNVATAERITATLSRSWSLAALQQNFTSEALASADRAHIEQAIDELKALGVLRKVRDPLHTPRRLYYVLGQGLVRMATVDFKASFSRGDAEVSVTLMRSRGVTKVQHLHIKPRALPKSSTGRHVV